MVMNRTVALPLLTLRREALPGSIEIDFPNPEYLTRLHCHAILVRRIT